MELNYEKIWKMQGVDDLLLSQLALIAELVRDTLYLDDRPTQNPSEWAKKEKFWTYLEHHLPGIEKQLTEDFWCYFVPSEQGIPE